MLRSKMVLGLCGLARAADQKTAWWSGQRIRRSGTGPAPRGMDALWHIRELDELIAEFRGAAEEMSAG